MKIATRFWLRFLPHGFLLLSRERPTNPGFVFMLPGHGHDGCLIELRGPAEVPLPAEPMTQEEFSRWRWSWIEDGYGYARLRIDDPERPMVEVLESSHPRGWSLLYPYQPAN